MAPSEETTDQVIHLGEIDDLSEFNQIYAKKSVWQLVGYALTGSHFLGVWEFPILPYLAYIILALTFLGTLIGGVEYLYHRRRINATE